MCSKADIYIMKINVTTLRIFFGNGEDGLSIFSITYYLNSWISQVPLLAHNILIIWSVSVQNNNDQCTFLCVIIYIHYKVILSFSDLSVNCIDIVILFIS